MVTTIPGGLFATHIVMRQFDGNIFNASWIWSNYDLYTNSTSNSTSKINGTDEGYLITNIGQRVQAEWVGDGDEQGWAFKGGLWGSSGPAAMGIDGELATATGKDSAEVWFGKDA